MNGPAMSKKLDNKLKTALDETRLLFLGGQVLLGLQFQAFFQDGFFDAGSLSDLPQPERGDAHGSFHGAAGRPRDAAPAGRMRQYVGAPASSHDTLRRRQSCPSGDQPRAGDS
jgi:hypothetical protein